MGDASFLTFREPKLYAEHLNLRLYFNIIPLDWLIFFYFFLGNISWQSIEKNKD